MLGAFFKVLEAFLPLDDLRGESSWYFYVSCAGIVAAKPYSGNYSESKVYAYSESSSLLMEDSTD